MQNSWKNYKKDFPNVLWHGTQPTNGRGVTYGLTLFDVDGDTETMLGLLLRS